MNVEEEVGCCPGYTLNVIWIGGGSSEGRNGWCGGGPVIAWCGDRRGYNNIRLTRLYMQ